MHDFAARAAAPSPAQSTLKVRREDIVRLTVETEICPQVLLRVLGLLAQRCIVPLTMEAQRSADGMRLEVDMELPADGDSETLTAKIEAIVMVRSARLLE